MKPLLLLILLMQVTCLCWDLWKYNNPSQPVDLKFRAAPPEMREVSKSNAFDPNKLY